MSPAGWRWQFSARDDLTAQLGPSLRKVSRAGHLWLGLPPAWQVTVSRPR